MPKLNPGNERIKRSFVRYLGEAKGKSEPTLDVVRKSLARYEGYTGYRDFKSFNREQAIGFKERLASTKRNDQDETLSQSTQASTLAALREFFAWLAWQPGYKSKIHVPDIEYLNLSRKAVAVAKATRLRDFPSIDQIRTVIHVMPANSPIERRNRALIAFAILTGIRDRAMASLCLRHIDAGKRPPLVRQEPDRVATKFSKSIVTYFFPLGDDLTKIVVEWVDELRSVHLYAPNDPLFPRTRVTHNSTKEFEASGLDSCHWSNASPIRTIFRAAFEAAGLPYYPPHTFRHTLGHLMEDVCERADQIKAWSQNLGHENVATTLTSYGKIDPHRQGDVIASISLSRRDDSDDVITKIRALVS